MPERFLPAGAHTAQAIRQANGVVLKPLASEGSAYSRRKISLTLEEGQTLPTIHERIDAITLDVVSEQVISGNPLLPLDRIGDAGELLSRTIDLIRSGAAVARCSATLPPIE